MIPSGELGEARSTILRLEGDVEYSKPELLPKKKTGWKRRLRTVKGNVDPRAYERIVQMIQSGTKESINTSLVGRILNAKARGFEITIMPGEGDDLVLLFDESRISQRPSYSS